jgi:hypothetical protein
MKKFLLSYILYCLLALPITSHANTTKTKTFIESSIRIKILAINNSSDKIQQFVIINASNYKDGIIKVKTDTIANKLNLLDTLNRYKLLIQIDCSGLGIYEQLGIIYHCPTKDDLTFSIKHFL